MSLKLTHYDQDITHLLTLREVKNISARYRIMCLLEDGITFMEIQQITGKTPNTISKISKLIKKKL